MIFGYSKQISSTNLKGARTAAISWRNSSTVLSRPGLATRGTSITVHRMPRTPPQAGTIDLIRQCWVAQPLYCGWAGLDHTVAQPVLERTVNHIDAT